MPRRASATRAGMVSASAAAAAYPRLRLMYFALRARAEPARLLLRYAGIPYEDEVVGRDWAKLKPTTPWGSLPVLVVDDTTHIAQTGAVCRYVAGLNPAAGLLPECGTRRAMADSVFECAEELTTACNQLVNRFRANSDEFASKKAEFTAALEAKLGFAERFLPDGEEYFGGSRPHFGDFNLFHVLDNAQLVLPDCLAPYPKLAAWMRRMEGLDALRAYLAERPQKGSGKVGLPRSLMQTKD